MAKARSLIESRQYVLESRWGDVQPDADAEDRFLVQNGWDAFGAWHLGLTVGATDQTKARMPSSTATSAASTAWVSSPAGTGPPNGATRRSSSQLTNSSGTSTSSARRIDRPSTDQNEQVLVSVAVG